SYVVAFALEASSVAVGFPFGSYEHHTGGPRLLDVPLIVPSAYFAFGWIAWVLASVMVRNTPSRPVGAERFTTPLVATVALTGWDFTFDAVYSTVNAQYSYAEPSGHFGVPVSNFLGWLLTGWIIAQVFAVVEPRVSTGLPVPAGPT
nr:carotenoid biosynthesis protein [Micromonospora sp. DSM 115978]